MATNKRKKRTKIHEPYMKFKGWIREKGITYEKISELLGCRIGTVCDKVNGLSDFYMYEIEKICSEYGATYDIFL